MQKWLDDKFLMYLTHNEGKSVEICWEIYKNFEGQNLKKITANDNESYLSYMNTLVDKFENTYHRSIDKKSIDADYFALLKEVDTYLKVGDRVGITKYKNIFS